MTIAGTTRRQSRPARTPSAKPASAHPAAAIPVSGKTVVCSRGRDAAVQERLVVPGDQCAERGHDDRDADRTGDQDGGGPPHPSDALGPGVAEGAGLEFSRQQRRAGESTDDAGQEHQHDADESGRAVAVVEHLELVWQAAESTGRHEVDAW